MTTARAPSSGTMRRVVVSPGAIDVVQVDVPEPGPMPLQLVQDQQLRIQGSATYLPQDVAGSIELLRSGVVRAEDLVTAVVPLDSVAEAFELAASRQHIKVLVAIDDADASRQPKG